jgi:ABC-type multidrug transport system fused ATPase/permease subunit
LTKTSEENNFPISARQRETRKLISIEKRSAQILVLFLLASLWFHSGSIILGLILGGAVSILNFRWLWRIMEKVLFERKKFYGLQALMKFIVLVFVVSFILLYVQVHPIAFIVGISTLVIGILFEFIWAPLRPERKGKG